MGKPDTRGKRKTKRPAKKAPNKPAAFIEPPKAATSKELGELLGVSDQTILDWAKLPGAPARLASGRYPIAEWLKFGELVRAVTPRGMRAHAAEVAITGHVSPLPPPADPSAESIMGSVDPSDSTNTATTTGELLRLNIVALDKVKLIEEIIRRRLENQERRGKLIPRSAVEEHLVSKASSAVAHARRLELELPLKLEGKSRPEIEEAMRAGFDELLRLIAALGDPVKVAKGKTEPPLPGNLSAPPVAPK